MAQAALRPPANLQPRPKAVASFSGYSAAATSATSTPPFSTPISQSRQPSPSRSPISADVSDKATAALVRRVLCPQVLATDRRSVEELLPPLTSSNDVDLQLYAIIAVIIKDLVGSWYGKITPDQTFVEEVIKIVAHCTRALESRLRGVDLEALVLDEVPALVEKHIQDYRTSHSDHDPQSLSTDPRVIYHNLNPHPALSPVPVSSDPSAVDKQSKNESDYRQLLVQGALAILLPTEDLENACLRTLVADVIAEVILGNAIGGKACQSWFIWNSITNAVQIAETRFRPQTTGRTIQVEARDRLEKFGLLTPKGKRRGVNTSTATKRSAITAVFWRILQSFFLAFITIRFVLVGLVAARSQPLRSSTLPKRASSTVEGTTPVKETTDPSKRAMHTPILQFRIFSLLSTLLDLRARSPWLSGGFALLQHHLVNGISHVGATDGIIDQFIHHTIKTHLTPSQFLPPALRLARQTLFPNSSIPSSSNSSPSSSTSQCSSQAPSAVETKQMKRKCATTIATSVPAPARRHWLGGGRANPQPTSNSSATDTSPVSKQSSTTTASEKDIDLDSTDPAILAIEKELDVWSDEYLNRHLTYSLIELVLVRALPELAEETVSGLVRGRLGGWRGNEA